MAFIFTTLKFSISQIPLNIFLLSKYHKTLFSSFHFLPFNFNFHFPPQNLNNHLLVNHLSHIDIAGIANNYKSQWRNKDTRDSWRKKGEDSHNLASITGETVSDLGALTVICSNQDEIPIKPSLHPFFSKNLVYSYFSIDFYNCWQCQQCQYVIDG